ncbi:hypothetical protein BC828DRAFT_377109, partial [Blastocladiella britannica]
MPFPLQRRARNESTCGSRPVHIKKSAPPMPDRPLAPLLLPSLGFVWPSFSIASYGYCGVKPADSPGQCRVTFSIVALRLSAENSRYLDESHSIGFTRLPQITKKRKCTGAGRSVVKYIQYKFKKRLQSKKCTRGTDHRVQGQEMMCKGPRMLGGWLNHSQDAWECYNIVQN